MSDIYIDCLEVVMQMLEYGAVRGVYSRDVFKGTDDEYIKVRTDWVNAMGASIDGLRQRHCK